MALSVSRSGTAVTVTSITNASAFFIGSLTIFPALESFAIWAGIGVLFGYVFQVTFFVANLTLDAQRQEQGRFDVVPCVRGQTSEQDWCGVTPGIMRRFFGEILGPLLLRNPVRVLVLVIAFGWSGVCCYGISKLHMDFKMSYFYPSGSFLESFDKAEQRYFPVNNIPLDVYTGPVDYELKDVQLKLLQLCSETGVVARSELSVNGTTTCWFASMHQAYNLSSTEFLTAGDFYPKLQLFLDGAGRGFRDDLAFDEDGKLRASKFNTLLVHLDSHEKEADIMDELRTAVGAVQLTDTFPFAYNFVFWEQYKVLESETMQSVGMALGMVMIVLLLLIPNPLVMVTVFIGVLLTAIDVLGIMYFWDINLNNIAITQLSVCVGLSVDFSAHMGLEFLENIGSRGERVAESLVNLGPALMHGGISTFLAVSLGWLGRSFVVQIFFKMFLSILLLGMAHGLLLVPVLLSFWGPPGFYESEKQKTESNVRITVMSAVMNAKRAPADRT